MKNTNYITEHFQYCEFDCHDKTPVPEIYYDNLKELCQNLEVLRLHVQRPINISSGFRTPEYNFKVGGKRKSQHLTASAADIYVKDLSPQALYEIIEYLINNGKMKEGGLGKYPHLTIIHYDIRGIKIRW